MVTKPKANSVITQVYDHVAQTLTFNVVGAGATVLKLTQTSEANRARAMVHGFGQKIADRAALSRDAKTGQPASAADKLAAMVELVEHLNSGSEDWTLARKGGVRGPSAEVEVLIAALCELSGKPDAEIRAKVLEWKPAQRVAMIAHKDVAPIVARLREGDAGAMDAELDALLG